mmetsp:Transcript_52668/g.113814  ORF Transcript_52668/g.113814 Transcript_52668/m.113814 type:complete len:291 (-) Transcript_52668:38-910(-)
MGSVLSVCGNLTAAVILLVGDILASVVSFTTHCLVNVIDRLCGSGKNTARRKVPWHKQRYTTAPVYVATRDPEIGELDVEATLKHSTFPIKPTELLRKAKEVLASEFGTAEGCDRSCLAEDFQFVAPIVGPLSKSEFLRAFGSFKIKEAIPDLKDNSWFQVDPLEPNRVWFFSRATGTHTGTLNFGAPIAATGKSIQMPPQAQSMLFNEQGQCYTLTVGYCMDKRIGNAEGLGGVFGILKAVGKPLPFPEAQQLYTPSLRFEAFEHVGKAMECLGLDPASRQRLPANARA